jgi:hypothetical protein
MMYALYSTRPGHENQPITYTSEVTGEQRVMWYSTPEQAQQACDKLNTSIDAARHKYPKAVGGYYNVVVKPY